MLRDLFSRLFANHDHAQLNPAEIVVLYTLANSSKEISHGDIHNGEIYPTLQEAEDLPSFQVHGFQITREDCHNALKHLKEMQLITDGWNPHHSRITNKGLRKLGLESADQLKDLEYYLEGLTCSP